MPDVSGTRLVIPINRLVVVSISGLLSGIVVGYFLGLCGSFWLNSPARLPISVVLAMGGILDMVGHQSSLGRNHETRYRSNETHRLRLLASNAAILATGFATRVGFASLYALAISIALMSSPLTGLLVWGTYGLVRTASVGPIARIVQTRSPLDLFSYRKRAVHVVGTITITVSVLTLIV